MARDGGVLLFWWAPPECACCGHGSLTEVGYGSLPTESQTQADRTRCFAQQSSLWCASYEQALLLTITT